MNDIIRERSDGILRIQLNRPSKKNAMTAADTPMAIKDMFKHLAEMR